MEKKELIFMFRLLKDKLTKINESHELLIYKSRTVAAILNKIEEKSSLTDDSLIKKLNKQSSSCNTLIIEHSNACKNYETFALKLYEKLNEYKMLIERQHEANRFDERFLFLIDVKFRSI